MVGGPGAVLDAAPDRGQPLTRGAVMSDDMCCVDGCQNPVAVKSRRLCTRHYNRWQRHGDPTAGGTRNTVPVACSVDGCETRSVCRGWCQKHYKRWVAHGDPLIVMTRIAKPRSPKTPKRVIDPVCSIDGCSKPTLARGWCSAHHTRWRRHGDPLAGGRTPMKLGPECTVDGCNSVWYSKTAIL